MSRSDVDISRPTTGIVHLGLGAFARAFVCPYVADAMAASGGNWGIVGVSLRSASTRDILRDQNWHYTAMSLGPDGEIVRDISALNNVLVAPENPQLVLDQMANPNVKIVSLTVTEKGYCHDPASGELNTDHPDIQHDLSHELPISAPGYLVRALQQRKQAGSKPFTVLSCDNLPANGQVLRRLVLTLAHLIDTDLADWIAKNGCFPSTMVDRITPATTEIDIARLFERTGKHDAALVVHEPFSQWAIEDTFVDGQRPDFAAAGAEMVSDVAAHEHMKLRMLNGTHSALAYTGYLAGHETIADTMADPVFSKFAKQLWTEISPTVSSPDGVSLEDYADALFRRYSNTTIRHQTWQIAMDGSQKIPQRWLDTLHENLNANRPAPALCLAVAAWMRYVGGVDENGVKIDVRDPLSAKLREVSDLAKTPSEKVEALLNVKEIFPPELALMLITPVSHAAERLWAVGSHAAIREVCGG